MYVVHLLYPFICQWTLRLLTCLGYYKQCCSDYQRVCILSNHGFLQIYAQEGNCWFIWQLYFYFLFLFFFQFQFFKELQYCSPQWLYQLTFPPTVQEGILLFIPSPTFIVCRLFDDGYSDWRASLMAQSVKNLPAMLETQVCSLG